MITLFQFGKKFAVPLWPWYVGGAFFLAATNLITLEIPQLAKSIIDQMEQFGDPSQAPASLSQLALIIIALGLLQVIVRSLSRILIFWPGRRLEEISKSFLFGKALSLPLRFFERYGMGDLISRLSNDLGQVRVFFAFAILQILNLVFLSVFTVTKMLQAHQGLTLVCLIPIVIMVTMTRYIMPSLAKFSKENQEAIGRLTNRVTEAFTNIHVLKLNAAEKQFQERIDLENDDVYRTNMRVIVLRTLFFPLLTSLTGLSQMIVLGYGGLQVIQGEISVGDILAFNIYLSYLAFPLTSIGIVISIFQRSKTAMERISPIFEAEPEKGSTDLSEPSLPNTVPASLLEIRKLNFRYREDTPLVLADINLSLQVGQKIGICGPVGSGKSTLFRLITRMIDPPPGTIFWRGRDVLSYDPIELRRDIGFSMQEVHLFSESIRNNLSIGINPKPETKQLHEATKGAQIIDEITAMQHGWETEIGEKGVRLSGGQKQRLALARLFLRQPRLLLLDDVLSAVDNKTEAKLIQYLNENKSSTLIASHRPSVLRCCKQVLLLKDGRIVATGPFAELLENYPEIGDQND